MKIVAIVSEGTSPGTIGLRIEPPLSKDIFDELQRRIEHRTTPYHTFIPPRSFRNGLLVVTSPALTPDDLKAINTELVAAEKAVSEKQDSDKKERQEFLSQLSESLGIQVE